MRFRRSSWYFYGASGNEHRDKMPTYLLQWEAMRWAKSLGCTTYDLWGVPDEDAEKLEAEFAERRDGLWSVYRFKRGFGGRLVRSVGAWDRVYAPLRYRLLDTGYSILRSLAAKMKLCITHPTSRAEWNSALAGLPAAHILQTWEWGAFKSRYGWQPTRYLWLDSAGDRPCAAASILTRRLGRYPSAVMYVPKGPALDYGNTSLLEQVLAHLEDTARRERALFLKIDPDVRADTAAGKTVVEALRGRGWRPSREQIQFRNTMLVDLNHSPDELLAAMKPKTRYNVRLAGRRGVVVRQGRWPTCRCSTRCTPRPRPAMALSSAPRITTATPGAPSSRRGWRNH